MWACRVEADSISPTGHRLTTFVVTFPRIILAEVNTHRMLSRNAASSRAIPVKKMLQRIKDSPFVPWPGKNRPGMQSTETLSPEDCKEFVEQWLACRDFNLTAAERLQFAHKQHVNRLLEPFAWTTQVVSATDWANFFALRTHKDASPEFRLLARAMWLAYRDSKPELVPPGYWHLPFIRSLDRQEADRKTGGNDTETGLILAQWSAARCARVSYTNHEQKRSIPDDEALWQKLISDVPRHSSPGEHTATPWTPESRMSTGNFSGWVQLRKFIPNENIREFAPSPEDQRQWEQEVEAAGVTRGDEYCPESVSPS